MKNIESNIKKIRILNKCVVCDTEDTFNILIDEDDCMDLYDMELEEAVLKIIDIMQKR